MSSSNVALLTRSHAVGAAKKRAKQAQIKEILFDDDARREFLTGFHKRKLEKKDASKKRAQQREKQDRLEARRDKRRLMAERAAENAAEVEAAYGNTQDKTFTGFSDKDKGKDKEEEYEDEEQLATVTIVEDFDPASLLYGSPPPPQQNLHPPARVDPSSKDKLPKHQDFANENDAKAGVKKFRYETKAGRKADKAKQHTRRVEKAERSGASAKQKRGGGRRR